MSLSSLRIDDGRRSPGIHPARGCVSLDFATGSIIHSHSGLIGKRWSIPFVRNCHPSPPCVGGRSRLVLHDGFFQEFCGATSPSSSSSPIQRDTTSSHPEPRLLVTGLVAFWKSCYTSSHPERFETDGVSTRRCYYHSNGSPPAGSTRHSVSHRGARNGPPQWRWWCWCWWWCVTSERRLYRDHCPKQSIGSRRLGPEPFVVFPSPMGNGVVASPKERQRRRTTSQW